MAFAHIAGLEPDRAPSVDALVEAGKALGVRRNPWAHGSQRTDDSILLEAPQIVGDSFSLVRQLIRFVDATQEIGAKTMSQFDFFICHASEDKAAVARPLAAYLRDFDKKVWIDETEIKIGDSLRAKIDEGLTQCLFGIVILSPSFFSKNWAQTELDALVAISMQDGRRRVLPIWHDVDAGDVARHSPILSGIAAARWSDGMKAVVAQIVAAAAS